MSSVPLAVTGGSAIGIADFSDPSRLIADPSATAGDNDLALSKQIEMNFSVTCRQL
jgi:hypothetical protein